MLMASAFAETVSTPSLLDEAKALISQGKQKDAIPILDKIAASDPTSAPQALQMTGECYKKLQKWSKAIECFDKLLAGYPNSIAADREVKAWIMDCHLANGDFEKCLALRNELFNEYQTDAWKLYYVVGRRHVWRHDYSKAIPELKKAVELGVISKNSPEMIDAHRRLLHCYVERKQWSNAEELAQKLVKDYPSRAYEWHFEMGRCYQGRQEYEKAIEYLEQAAKLVPKNAWNAKDIFKALLDCYDHTGTLDKGVPLAEKLVEKYPRESSWQWRLGWYYLTRKDYQKAAPLFERVMKSSDRRWEIRKSQIYLGQCMFNLGKGDQALKMIESYFKDKPDLWDEHLLVKGGVLFYGPKDDAGCVATLKELLAQVAAGKKSALVPTTRELMYKAFNRMGDLNEAASVLETRARDAGSLEWLCQAGDDYYKARDYVEAKRVYKEVMHQADLPQQLRASSMYGLALCYWETGLKDAARRLMQEVSDRYPSTDSGKNARGSLYLWSQGE